VYGVHDLGAGNCATTRSRGLEDQIVEKFLGTSLLDDVSVPRGLAALLRSAKSNATAFLLAWGTEDDVVDHKEQSEAFLEALKQAGHYARSVVVAQRAALLDRRPDR